MQDIAERYIASWNETEPQRRRELIGELWAEDASYTDPLVEARGPDEINEMIGAVQAQFPGLLFRLAGPVDAHHRQARFTWSLGPAGGEPAVVGFDVAVTAEDGKLTSVYGFLDKVPS
jgi:hypothetical protein